MPKIEKMNLDDATIKRIKEKATMTDSEARQYMEDLSEKHYKRIIQTVNDRRELLKRIKKERVGKLKSIKSNS